MRIIITVKSATPLGGIIRAAHLDAKLPGRLQVDVVAADGSGGEEADPQRMVALQQMPVDMALTQNGHAAAACGKPGVFRCRRVLVVMSTWYFAAAAEKAAISSLRTS